MVQSFFLRYSLAYGYMKKQSVEMEKQRSLQPLPVRLSLAREKLPALVAVVSYFTKTRCVEGGCRLNERASLLRGGRPSEPVSVGGQNMVPSLLGKVTLSDSQTANKRGKNLAPPT